MPAVYIAHCPDYGLTQVRATLQQALDELGGMSSFVRPGWRVLLKPNLLRPALPEQAVSTHPALVRAVAELVLEAGATPIIADSPGGPHNRAYLSVLYRLTGMAEIARELGISCNEDMRTATVPNLEGQVLKGAEILAVAAEADAIINLPKLKTHGLTMLTGAVKNLYGVIPGLGKTTYHAKLQTAHEFSRMLIDLSLLCKPVLTIMDGIVGMEGNGPSGGEVRQVGAILASADGMALDLVAATLVGIDPLRVPTLVAAMERGLVRSRAQDIEVQGQPLAQARLDPPFRLPDTAEGQRSSTGLLSAVARLAPGQATKAYPVANARCTACRTCVRACPVQVISIVNGRAHMDLKGCIRCYCCHEMCPYKAIDLRRHWWIKWLVRS